MLVKIDENYVFDNKRNKNIVTPCCGKRNSDGKFVNYKDYPLIYGYCHSCGTTTLPPSLYRDDANNLYQWNEVSQIFEPYESYKYNKPIYKSNERPSITKREINYIDFKLVEQSIKLMPENNLLKYLRNTFGNQATEFVKQKYFIGTNKDQGTVFWSVNKEGKAQKAKISYYTLEGKRTKYFKVPFKNEGGFYSCLYGEHLINQHENSEKQVILVESEKTAIVCDLHFPKYNWLAYGGINGLTQDKLETLKGRRVILVPDMSENAVSIMKKKLPILLDSGIEAKIWDMTKGKKDKQLKEEGVYNCDLEDFLRRN